LVGKTCHYRSGNSEPLGQLADSLCPPPEVFHGQSASSEIQLAESGGGLAQRYAQFTPLLNLDGSVAGVLARIAPVELASESLLTADPDAAAAESRRLHVAIERMRAELSIQFSVERLIGNSPAMRRVRAQVDTAANSHAAVLVVGPSGSGKQHV